MAIRINELLALRSELTRVMFSMVAAGRRNLMAFSRQKAVDERWEVVYRMLGFKHQLMFPDVTV